MSQLSVRQQTNPSLIKALIFVNLALYILLFYANQEYPDAIPRIYPLLLLPHGYLFYVYRKSKKSPEEESDRFEFREDQILLFMLLALPAGLLFLLFRYVLEASFATMLVSYIAAVVAGTLLAYREAGNRIVLKDHTVTFMHGLVRKTATTVPYENVSEITLVAATDGISVSTQDGKVKETYRWMADSDNLQKLLRQRVLLAQSAKTPNHRALSLDELAEKRLSGAITEEEFFAAIKD